MKNKILKETNSEKLNDLLNKEDINILELFADIEVVEHLRKYFKYPKEEAEKHIYIRKAERKERII